MSVRKLSWVMGIGALMLLTGCERRFTRSRFEMIRVGVDDRADVRTILGKPVGDLDQQWFYDDTKRHYSAIIYFDEHGRVSSKQWMNAKTGEWIGRNPDADEPPAGEVREQHRTTTRIDED